MTDEDRLPVPTQNDVIKWCNDAHDSISKTSIVKTFAHIGLIDIGTGGIDDDDVVNDEDFHDNENLDDNFVELMNSITL